MMNVIQTNTDTPLAQTWYVPNIKDLMTSTAVNPLFGFKSLLSKKELYFLPTLGVYYNDRYGLMFFYTTKSSPNPLIGYLQMGTTDYPYGMYELTIYQNNISGNLEPANAIKTVYNGLMNLSPLTTNPAVEYTDYDTNDTETESVYITF